MTKKPKVMLGMSGGVDSSVAAEILQKAGYEVVGVTMKVLPDDTPNPVQENVCCSLDAVEDARRVANKLNIPHYVLNFTDYFQTKVIDYFLEAYLEGKTPNPCIACNKELKFGELITKADKLEIDYIATGHYANVYYDEDRKRYLLKKGKDSNKDQSYVLYNLSQEQLARIKFPLGDLTKPEVRELASHLDLRTANKPESQEICFIPDNNYRNFIAEKAEQDIKPGNFVDPEGNIVGKHQGIPYYTIGQRKGLGLALGYPVHVVDICPEKNEIIVGGKKDLLCTSFIAKDNNYILIPELTEPLEVKVKIRYKAEEVSAVIYPLEKNRVRVELVTPQNAVTPGQAVVYYQGDLVVGGGEIETRIK